MFRKRYSKGIAILLSAMVFFAAFGMLDVYPLSAEENSIANPANLSADHTNNTSDNAADTAGAADPSGTGGSMDAADLAGDASGADAAAMISGASNAEGSAAADAAGLYADASDPAYDGTGADSGASYDLQKSTGARARRSYQSMMSEDAFSPEAVHEDAAVEQVDAVDPTETEIPVIADLPPPSDADPTGQNAQADAAAAEHAGGAIGAENTAPAGEAGQDAAAPESGDANPVVTLTATDNKSYTITVSYNRLETRIPADAVLKAEPVEHKDPRFAPYAAQTANLLREKWAAQAGGQAADPAGTPSAGAAQATGQTTNPMNYNFTSPDDLRLFDIRLVSGTDGVTEYEPAEGTKVNVTIRLHNENEAVTKAAGMSANASGAGSASAVSSTGADAVGTGSANAAAGAGSASAVPSTGADAVGTGSASAGGGANAAVNAVTAHPNTLATGVVHFNENSDVMTAAVTQVGADMEYKFDTDGFSLYGMATVDFTYNGFTYHIPVGSEILLSALFAELGISENAAEAQEVWFSNNELIVVEKIDGDWKLTSTIPFQTEELLRVVMGNGTVYEVQVTDEIYEPTTTLENGGTYLIIGKSGNNYYALRNLSNSIQTQSVTVANGKITDPSNESSCLWTVSGTPGSSMTITNGGRYLSSSGIYNLTLEVSQKNTSNWQWNGSSLYAIAGNVYLNYENGFNTGYTSNNTLSFYKVATPADPVESISLDPTSISDLPIGQTSSIAATVLPATALQSVSWTSSNPSVASVINGVVTGVSVGTATITATTDGTPTRTATCTVNVISVPVTGINISATTLFVSAGQSSSLTASVAPTTATNKGITWTTSNSSVATYNAATGQVTVPSGATQGQTAIITATSNENSSIIATCTIIVKGAPTYQHTKTLESGKKYLIVSRYTNGQGYVLRRNNNSIASTSVNVSNGEVQLNNANCVWVATGSGTQFTLKNTSNSERYLSNVNRSLQISTTGTEWTWDSTNERLYSTVSGQTGYLRSSGSTFDLLNNSPQNIYFFVEQSAYSITFDANGGTGTMTPNPQTGSGTSITLNANTFSRTGYSFTGWNTQADGLGTSYANSATISTSGDTALTLYAQWQQDVSNHTVTFNLNGHGASGAQPAAQTVAHNGTATVPSPAPSDTNYNFDGWYENDQGTGSAFDFSTQITADKVLYAKWTPKTYTITWKNDDDSLIDTTEVAYGSMPSHADPTKASTAEYSYSFAGWSPTLVAVTGPATYTATYTQTTRTYTITWLDGDGGTLKAEQVAYGSTPAYTGATPTKTATAQYTYTFNDTWSPAITSVTGDKTYTAQFDSTVRKYTITWKDGDDNTLTTDQVDYGTIPAYSGATPTKTATAQYTYTFNNSWSPTIVAVTGAATYTAQFDSTVRKYTVTWNNYDGTTLETDTNVEYGTTPTYDGTTPTKPQDANYTYTFSGWTPAISSVTGDATYTATYSSTARVYNVTVDSSITNGSVTSNKATAAVGETVTLTVTPATGYELDQLTVTSGGSPVTVTGDQFTMPAGDVTVTATFRIRTDTIYKYVTSVEDGKNYLIVSRNADGNAYALRLNGTSFDKVPVIIENNGEITYNDSVAVWEVSGTYSNFELRNNGTRIGVGGTYYNTLAVDPTALSNVSWVWSLDASHQPWCNTYLFGMRWDGSNFVLLDSRTSGNVYFFEEQAAPITYSITFDANDGSGTMDPNPQTGTGTTFKLNANTFTPPNPSLSFIGWNTASDGSGTPYEDQHTFTISAPTTLTLYAQWGTPVYTITLNNQSATTPGTTAYYEKYGVGNYAESTAVTPVTSITPPTRTNYTFGGYFTETNGGGTQYIDANGSITATSTTFSADTTLYALWHVNVTLTYNKASANSYSGSMPTYSGYGPVQIIDGSFLNGHSTQGYFIFWTTDSNYGYADPSTYVEPGSTFNLTTPTTLYALFGHTITFEMDGKGLDSWPESQKVVYGTKPLTPSVTPEDPHFNFVDWYYDSGFSDPFNYDLEVREDRTIYAKWTIKNHTITYDANGGTGTQMADTTAEYNTPVTLRTNTYTNSGYVFTGWNTKDDGSGTAYADGATFNIPDDMTLYAQWKHSVTFDMNGAPGSPLPAVQYVVDGGYATEPDTDPSAAGYIFGGWYEEAVCTTPFDFTTPITTNTIIYAKWSSNVTNLTITNNVTGAMGDSTKDFSYTVTGLTANTTYIAEANGTPTSITTDGSGAGTFTLRGGQSYEIHIPTGTTGVGVAQTDYSSEGYQSSYVLDSGSSTTGYSVSALSMSSNHTVTFTNTKAAVSPTAYRAERTAYVFILLLGGGVLAACLLLWRRGKRQKGGAPRQKN